MAHFINKKTGLGRSVFLKSLRNSRGQSVLMVVFSTLFLLALSGFAADLGRIYLVRQDLRKLADATASAAVVQTPTLSEAISIVHGIADLNEAGSSTYIADSDIKVGEWDFQSKTFTPAPANADDNKAVRVTVRRTAANGSPLNLIFAPIVGLQTMDLNARATAAATYPLCGIIGVEKLTATGTANVDSYHSGDGPYSPATALSNGTLCSDGTIKLTGDVEVHGDAIPGKDDEVKLIGGATVSGSTEPRTTKLVIAPIVLGDVATNNNNAQIPLTSKGKNPLNNNNEFLMTSTETLQLPAGTYFFTNMSLKGQAQITTNDPVVIFVDGNVDIGGGGIVNSSGIPTNLQIFATGTSVKYSGNSAFYGLLYAPDADVTVSGVPEFFGALVGATATISGTPFIHYDEDLKPFKAALRAIPVLVE